MSFRQQKPFFDLATYFAYADKTFAYAYAIKHFRLNCYCLRNYALALLFQL